MKKENSVVTRIAPSPTGYLHVGTARSALFNYLFAKKHNGSFVVRIEDTDKERSKKEYEDDIVKSFSWLGLTYDSFCRQSERGDVYHTYIMKLLDSKAAYISREPRHENKGEEISVIRLKNPGKIVTFKDEVRGDISFDTTELKDFVIARGERDPVYHLAVVIDDYDMHVTHVIRGDDHISNTPRQILIQEALGFSRPVYAHIPLILAPDRSKLSKRHGAVAVSEYMKDYLPEAFINYIALLGWNPGTPQEYFTLTELIQEFDLSRIQKGGAVFDEKKLRAMNQHYIKHMDETVFAAHMSGFLPNDLKKMSEKTLRAASRAIQERVSTLTEARTMFESGDIDFYFHAPSPDPSHLVFKDDTHEIARTHLQAIVPMLSSVPDSSFTEETIKDAIFPYATEKGRGSVLWPMRYALTGKDKSPDPFTIAEAIGKQETLERISKGAALLS